MNHSLSILLCSVFLFVTEVNAQSNPALVDPFQDDEPVQQGPTGSLTYNPFSEQMIELFGPGGAPYPTPTPPTRWQDLDQVDPGGRFSGGYQDEYQKKIDAVVNAPLPKKKLSGDPLEGLKKDPGQGMLFGPPGKEGR